MNWGKFAVIALVGATAAAGAGIWYTQEYAYYDELDPASVTLTAMVAGQPVPLMATDLEAIDATSAPHRWRACLRLTEPLPEGAEPFEIAAPTNGPRWFGCFDAEQIGADLASGAAKAYLSQPDIHLDVDRVIAVYPDGRAYGWHQLNDKTPARGVMD